MAIENIKVDFLIIDEKEPTTLALADLSTWSVIQNEPTIVEITLPGESEPVSHYLNKNQINIYNSNFLGLSCPTETCEDEELLDLPDGIYEITVKGSPPEYFKTRKYLRTTLTELELDKLYINLDLLCDNQDVKFLEKLTDIDLLLKAAHAHVRHDNACKAQDLLFRAQELIEKSKGCSGCVDA